MSTYKPTVIIAGRENQLDDPDGLDVAHLANVDYTQFDITYADGAVEGRLQWNTNDGTLEVGMPGGNVTLQIGQEHLVRCRNTTGNTINNGSVVYISGQSGNKPLIALSKADDKSTAIVFGVATENIANNDNGYVTTTGMVRSMNTFGLVEGSYVFLSATTAGGLETSPAVAPSYKARVGYCISTHNSEGSILVDSSVVNNLTSLSDCYGTPTNVGDYMAWTTSKARFEVTSSKSSFFNGTFRESFDFLLSSADGVEIVGSLEQSGGGDLTMQFSGGEITLNCTPAQTIEVTPGTDSNPIGYMVYIPQDSETLTIATSWPVFTQHIRVAYILVPSALYVLDHGGGYINQNWNDHLSAGGAPTNDQGHLEHICNRIRQQGADWYSGVSPDGASDSYFTINTGNVYWQSTEGSVFQLHPHTFTAKDTAAVDLTLVVNDPDSTYNHIQNLYTSITKDSTGNTISNNRYFNLVFWGVANKTGDGDRIMINLPSGVYTTETNGVRDTAHYDNYNFPREFDIESGTAFLICRATFKMGSNDWTWVQTEDLRGLAPNKTAGVGGVDDHGSLGGLADDDHTQYVLVDGTRDFTGNVTGNVTLNTGNVTLHTGSITLNTGDLVLNSGNITLTGGGGITIDGVAVTNDHGSLDGLSDDDHTQYVMVDGTRTTEHGFLSGLTDDDHTHYALVDGTRAFTGNITVQGVVNAQAYDTGNYRIDETSSRLQFINQLGSGDTDFDFLPDPTAGDGEDDVTLNIWATGGGDSEYWKIGYESDLSPQRYVFETRATGGGAHHPIYFVHSGSDVLTIDSNGLTLLDDHGITLNSGNITSTSGDITLESGNVTLNTGNVTLNTGDITLNSGNIAVTDGDITFSDSFVPKMINAHKSIYLRTTGDDSNGGYSSGDAFLTPARVITELAKWMAQDYSLLVNVGEGTFNVASLIDPSHIYGNHIFWAGIVTAHTSLTIDNIDGLATALSAGLEYIDFDVTFAGGSGAAVGQFVIVKTTSGGSSPNLVKGCHEIIAYSTNVATVRCVRVAGSTTLPSGAITADTLTLVKTVFDFNGPSHGILANSNQHAGNWDKIAIKGDLPYSGVWVAGGAAIVLGVDACTSKWGTNLKCQGSSTMLADFSTHSYSNAYLASVDESAVLVLRFGILSGGRGVAGRAFEGARLNFTGSSAICAGALQVFQAFSGGYISASNTNVEGCIPITSVAFYVTSGGGVDSSGATDDAATSRGQELAPGGNGSYHVY